MDNPESFRPRYHFTPPANWMNDPNGLVVHNGTYHLFYQHNPYAAHWGHMSWGHAVSGDLIHWDHRPVAIREDPDAGYTIFSGSAVVDVENRSGFGSGDVPAIVAIYTADYRDRTPPLQTIHIAYSTDEGDTFTEYEGNPVLDEGERKFGDPKVFWHGPTERWIMVTIFGHEQGHVILYGSEDLKRWTRLSEFHAPEAAPGIWECPDLFPLPVDGDPDRERWVLKVNCVRGPEEPPATRYFLGDFDGSEFTGAMATGRALTSDDGAIYAEVTYNGVPDGRRILMGWLREQLHPDRPWTGAQALPRVLTLRSSPSGPTLTQHPALDLQVLRGQHWGINDRPVTEPLPVAVDLSDRSLELTASFELGDGETVGLKLALDSGSQVTVGYNKARGELFVDPGEGRRVAVSYALPGDVVTLHVYFDQAIVEAFAGESGLAFPAGLTALMPFGATYERLSLFAEGRWARLRHLDAWRLAPNTTSS